MKPKTFDPEIEMPGNDVGLTRRDFLGAGMTGLFVFMVPDVVWSMQERERPGGTRPSYPTDFNAYLRVGDNGRVTCMVGKIEMGQGAMTSLAQLLAGDLDVRLDSVDMIMGDTDQCPWDMGTFGSLSTRQFGPVLRAAAAEARAVLVQMASERLEIPAEQLTVQDGVVRSVAGGRQITYAQLVAGKQIARHIDKVPVKLAAQVKIFGESPARKDAMEKVTGKAVYSGDLKLPGLLHARMVRPPAHGATMKDVDVSAAQKRPGVTIVRDGDLVAVLHERRDLADAALDVVKATFDPAPAGVNDQTIFDHLVKTAPQARVVHESGSLAEGEKASAGVIEQTYLNSYVAHAAMETHSATAHMVDGKVTVWASTQTPFPLKQQIMQTLGLPAEKVRVITPYVGGGFGGKSAGRQALEAARLAKLTGKPVQVVWDRSEEFFYDTFRPAAVVKVRSGTDARGKIVLWQFNIIGAGEREARQFYEVAHQQTTSAGGWGGGNPQGFFPLAVGPWRAPSVNTNTFARESQIDIMAAKLGLDPVEFRMNNLTNPRMRKVLEAATKQFGWQPGKLPSGRGVGVALGTDSGAFVATIAEVAVDKASGKVQVKRVVCAQDEGVIVNRDGSLQQMEGCITMGIGYALTEEVRFRDGAVQEHNFDSYQIPRFSWLPKIETVLVENPDVPPQGAGEPAIITMGAVIANAIFDATGSRLLQLPMTQERIKAALGRI
jgi:nicotinate dehydrogenase subunit B